MPRALCQRSWWSLPLEGLAPSEAAATYSRQTLGNAAWLELVAVQDIYNVPPGYHGDALQAGTLNHYEFGHTLFVYGGMQTKHTSQSDADIGVPAMMPFSSGAKGRYPWRWG